MPKPYNASCLNPIIPSRGGSRNAATSEMELFVIIVDGFQPLTIITKSSSLDVAAVLDPPLPSPQNSQTHVKKLAAFATKFLTCA